MDHEDVNVDSYVNANAEKTGEIDIHDPTTEQNGVEDVDVSKDKAGGDVKDFGGEGGTEDSSVEYLGTSHKSRGGEGDAKIESELGTNDADQGKDSTKEWKMTDEITHTISGIIAFLHIETVIMIQFGGLISLVLLIIVAFAVIRSLPCHPDYKYPQTLKECLYCGVRVLPVFLGFATQAFFIEFLIRLGIDHGRVPLTFELTLLWVIFLAYCVTKAVLNVVQVVPRMASSAWIWIIHAIFTDNTI